MQRFLFLLLLVITSTQARAQADSTSYLTAGDTVITFVHPMGEIMLSHTIQPGQTLYSLAKFYGLTLQELYAYNPQATDHYNNGDMLRIPLPLKAIIRQGVPDNLAPVLVQVNYRVRRGDTMYGLTKRTFNVTEEWLRQMNPALNSGTLRPGMILRVGWMSTEPIPSEWREIKGGPYAKLNHSLKLAYFRNSEGKRISSERGAAVRPENANDDTGFYCLHRTAPEGSIVEVNNPLTRQTMYLTVIGRVPETVYERNVLLVVSPLAYKALGARDTRFYVQVKHY